MLKLNLAAEGSSTFSVSREEECFVLCPLLLTESLSSNQTTLSELNKFVLSSYSKTASAKSTGKEFSLGFTCNVLTNKWLING